MDIESPRIRTFGNLFFREKPLEGKNTENKAKAKLLAKNLLFIIC